MTNSPKSTVQSSSHPHTFSRNTFTVSSRESLKQTILAHFAAIGVYPLPHGACCSQRLDSAAMASLRKLFRICGIRILLGMARRMVLERESGTY